MFVEPHTVYLACVVVACLWLYTIAMATLRAMEAERERDKVRGELADVHRKTCPRNIASNGTPLRDVIERIHVNAGLVSRVDVRCFFTDEFESSQDGGVWRAVFFDGSDFRADVVRVEEGRYLCESHFGGTPEAAFWRALTRWQSTAGKYEKKVREVVPPGDAPAGRWHRKRV